MHPTPHELHLKGVPLVLRPMVAIWGITRSGGETADPAMNKPWAAGLIGRLRPELPETRRLFLAHGIELRGGEVAKVRAIRVHRALGFPALVLDPIRGWRREGTIAGPAGRLPG